MEKYREGLQNLLAWITVTDARNAMLRFQCRTESAKVATKLIWWNYFRFIHGFAAFVSVSRKENSMCTELLLGQERKGKDLP